MSAVDQFWRRDAGDQRGGDDDVLLLDVLGGKRRLLGLVLFRHFLGVAAGGFRLLEFLVLDREGILPLGFRPAPSPRGAPSVAVTTAPRRRAVAIACRPATPTPITNTFAAGMVPAAVIIIGNARPNAPRLDHGAVAGEIGLARQHVHHLRAGDARHQFHREGRDAGIGHRLQRGVVAVGVHDRDHQRAALVLASSTAPAASP
jgi:hypothetical protein